MARLSAKAKRVDITQVELDDKVAEGTRDYVMARLAASRACLAAAVDSIDEAMSLFVDTSDDKKGRDREELVDSALESAGMGTRALECAQEKIDYVDPQLGEPWDEDGEDDEEEED